MRPFLRPATPFGAVAKPTPDGWSHRGVGTWRGRAVDIVFDPDAHEIVVIAGAPSPTVLAAMANTGWQRCGQDGTKQWWLRNRVAPKPCLAGRATPGSVLAR